ncbi:MAG: AtpZ/AtpI family protein [Mycobacterium sp.]|nr:AtpZ/AtpI family protein [Mycobacterium sp.]
MSRDSPSIGELIALGSTIVGSVVGGLIVGIVLDRHFHMTPVFTLIGTGAGIAGAAVTMYRLFRRLPKE